MHYRTAALDKTFTVFEPSGVDHVDYGYLFQYPLGQAGAGMHVTVYLAPTNVSFYRVQCMEVGENASGVWGYFTQFPPDQLAHNDSAGANTPIPVNCDNSWDHNWDNAYSATYGPPWNGGGGFTWVIPGKWWIGNGPQHDIHFSDQVFSMDGSGTMTVTKFGHRVTRRTSEWSGNYE